MKMIIFFLHFISYLIFIKPEKTFHHFTFSVDYDILNRVKIAGKKYELLKESLKTSVQIINSILLVKSGGKIEELLSNPDFCGVKIPFLSLI